MRGIKIRKKEIRRLLISAAKNSISSIFNVKLARAISTSMFFAFFLFIFIGTALSGDVIIRNGQINATGNITFDVNTLFVDINNDKLELGLSKVIL